MHQKTSYLVSAADIGAGAVEVSEWGRAAFRTFTGQIQGETGDFPCVYAIDALKRSALRYAFIDGPFGESSLCRVHAALLEYLKAYRTLVPSAREERGGAGAHRLTSFVAFFAHEEGLGLVEYERRFWRILEFLHRHDPAPWPADVPTDVEHESWEFCFAGEPIFIVCNTPAHQRRSSRRSPSLVLTFQPRWVFAGLEPDREAGIRGREVVRRRLAAYDQIAPSPALGGYGQPGNREWKQYFLSDSNEDLPTRCPFKVAHPAVVASARPLPTADREAEATGRSSPATVVPDSSGAS
jgi:FPC/CPF motif-containing protein YcgG